MKAPLPGRTAIAGNTRRVSRSRFDFWYFGVLRLFMGLAQMAAVIWCAILLWADGFSAKTMRVVFSAAGITTVSLLLFRFVSRESGAPSNSDASEWTNGQRWKIRGSAISKN